MWKLLIPALIITSILGFLLFIFGKDDDLIDFINQSKEKLAIYNEEEIGEQNSEVSRWNFTNEAGEKWQLILIKLNTRDYDLNFYVNENGDFYSIEEFAKEKECVYAMNGIFYDKNFKLLGLVMKDGKKLNDYHEGELSGGIFYYEREGKVGITRKENFVCKNEDLVLQSGPVILFEDGSSEVTEKANEESGRSLLAIDFNDNLYLGIVYPTNERVGASLYELRRVFVESEEKLGIKMKSVLNLDGGSSTGLFTKDFYLAEKNVPQNILCVQED